MRSGSQTSVRTAGKGARPGFRALAEAQRTTGQSMFKNIF